jgi:hypothetical protein
MWRAIAQTACGIAICFGFMVAVLACLFSQGDAAFYGVALVIVAGIVGMLIAPQD